MGNRLVTSNASLGTELPPATFETEGGSCPSKVISVLHLKIKFLLCILQLIFFFTEILINISKDRMAQTTYLLLGRQLKLSVLTKELAMIGQQLIEAWGKAAF